MARPKIKRIHVNQHHIRSNKTKGTDLPVITVQLHNGAEIKNAVPVEYGIVTDENGNQNPYFKVKKNEGKNIGKIYYIPADGSEFGIRNRSTIGTALGVKADLWNAALNQYYSPETRSAKFQVKAEGGLIEPKSISKKFHDKSRNLTKFVYSDGSEEMFNGLL